ncbi:hypothetical protein AB4Y45_35615 [Paraburkholderia sp. EG287A]|uniref:hypothetical protein n=1 Tax=Paraburkholderia sp. EG287A TaxID=3237012 RepID=UPI0034D1A5E0
MNRYSAVLYVESFGRASTKLAEVYDADEKLRTALNLLITGFEYADFAQKTMREIRHYLHYMVVAEPSPTQPDFDAVRDLRMSEMTPAQRDDAKELWLREQVGWMGDYYQPHFEFLFKRIDVLRAAIPAADDAGPEVLPGATAQEIDHVMMQDIVGDYDVPDNVPEWSWVETNASFQHIQNGQHGVWEFILNLSLSFEDIPEKLQPTIAAARAKHCAYLAFHQGT